MLALMRTARTATSLAAAAVPTARASFATKAVKKPKILITGSLGQLGSELSKVLRAKYGEANVIESDIRKAPESNTGPFIYGDVLSYYQLESIVVNERIDWVVHFSALLSAIGEQNPQKALAVNVTGFQNVLELAKVHGLRLFCPSTIGAFGPTTPRENTPDLTIMRPTTIYGITKVHMELLGEYYCLRYGVDFRSLRYPGVISADTDPGGGTTDYAVDIYHGALKKAQYSCFLSENTRLPMMYMPDCLKATVMMLEADPALLKQRTYNVSAMSFTPAEITESIRKHVPKLKVDYKPDFRQKIADSWPMSLDDSRAREDWGWKAEYDLDQMTADMIPRLRKRLNIPA